VRSTRRSDRLVRFSHLCIRPRRGHTTVTFDRKTAAIIHTFLDG